MSVEPIAPRASSAEQYDPAAQAIRSLPLQQPPSDGWQRLYPALASAVITQQAAMPSTRLARRRTRWLALAAVLAMAAITLRWQSAHLPTPAGTDTPDAAIPLIASRNDQLIEQSAQLESLLAWMAPGSRTAEALAVDVSLVDRLQWIDYLLTDPQTGAATREVLWSERVELLTQRVALSQRESLVAIAADAGRSATL